MSTRQRLFKVPVPISYLPPPKRPVEECDGDGDESDDASSVSGWVG